MISSVGLGAVRTRGNVDCVRPNSVFTRNSRSALGLLLFLIYINDIASASNELSFPLFSVFSNIFYTSDDINNTATVMNCEMTRVLSYCSINKSSVFVKKILTSC